ncbi:MAG: DNA polymerase IV [Deltaproteobacteria bacterium]
MPGTRLVLHVDADAFFASVEQALQPELKGKAVMVGGSDRGVVSAASYEARRYGVHSAMPVVQARRLCPHGIFLKPNFLAYRQFSRRMFQIMREYSPLVEVTSVDEGYMDLTGTLRLHRAPPWEIAHRILVDIRSQLGINASGGMAGNKTAAKMATGIAKPNGLLYLEPELAPLVLGQLPVGTIPGVGKKARIVLQRHGIRTVGDLAGIPTSKARSLLGLWGERLVETASGRRIRPVRSESREAQKSYSQERTLTEDTVDYAFVRRVAREIAEKLIARLRADGKGASTVTFKVRYADFTDKSRSVSLKEPTNENREILARIDSLFRKTITRSMSIRQVGVKLSGIDRPAFQEDLFEPDRTSRYQRDKAVDLIRNQFGFEAVCVSDWTAEPG